MPQYLEISGCPTLGTHTHTQTHTSTWAPLWSVPFRSKVAELKHKWIQILCSLFTCKFRCPWPLGTLPTSNWFTQLGNLHFAVLPLPALGPRFGSFHVLQRRTVCSAATATMQVLSYFKTAQPAQSHAYQSAYSLLRSTLTTLRYASGAACL